MEPIKRYWVYRGYLNRNTGLNAVEVVLASDREAVVKAKDARIVELEAQLAECQDAYHSTIPVIDMLKLELQRANETILKQGADLAAAHTTIERLKAKNANLWFQLQQIAEDPGTIAKPSILRRIERLLYKEPHPGQRYVEAMELLRTIVGNADCYPDERRHLPAIHYVLPGDLLEMAKRLVEEAQP